MNLMNLHKTLSLLVGGLMCFTAHADVDVRVGSGGGCATSSIQTAIDNANNANGITRIKIANNTTYQTNRLDIVGKNVHLIGGFSDCNDGTPDGPRTVINGAGGTPDSVFKVRGATTSVAFFNLDIVNGDAVVAGRGGGVQIEDGPHAIVYFENTWIFNNVSGEGGGVWVRNEFSSNPNDVFVWFNHNTRIFSNRANFSSGLTATTGNGGGVFCANAKIDMLGDVSALIGTHISENYAERDGGGVRAQNCVMNIATRQIIEGTIDRNVAYRDGGAMSVSGNNSIINLYNTNQHTPTLITRNGVQIGSGAGVSAVAGARINAYDVIISDNGGAARGGAAAIESGSTFVMTNVAGAGLPGGSVTCGSVYRCNRISGNNSIYTFTEDPIWTPGAAIFATGGSTVTLTGVEIESNRGSTLIEFWNDGSTEVDVANLNGIAATNNTTTENLFKVESIFDQFRVLDSTIAGNTIGASASFRSVLSTSDVLGTSFKRSIHWQPGKQLYDVVAGSANVNNTDYILSNTLLGIPASIRNISADPIFVGTGDHPYQLTLSSPALDWVPIRVGAATADHLPRIKDLVTVPDEFAPSPQDLGAYELQFEGAVNTAPSISFLFGQNPTVLEDGVLPLGGYQLTDPNGDVDGRLTVTVSTNSGGFVPVAFPPDIAVDVFASNPSHNWFGNNASLAGQMDSLSNAAATFTSYLEFRPKPDINGPVTVNLSLSDLGNTGVGGELVDTDTINVTITPVNDAPTATVTSTISRNSSALGIQVENLETHVLSRSVGPSNESGQTILGWLLLSPAIVSDPQGVLSGTPSLTNEGLLAFNLSGQAGTATIQTAIRDSGGTANSGMDVSNPITFDIIVSGESLFANGFESNPTD